MYSRQSFHIALLLWGCIFSLIAAFCMFISRNFNREKRKWLLFIQLSSALLLLSDAFAWGYRGSMEPEAAIMVRISNFLVFVLSDVILFFFHGYVCCYLFPDSQNRIALTPGKRQYTKQVKLKKWKKDIPEKRIRAVSLITVLGILMVIVSQFTHLYYYIDAQNYYHRNPGYIFSMLFPVAGMILDFSILIQNRKKMGKEVFVAMMSYLILPFLATIILIFYYGISLVNIAISISVVLMFITAMMEQNQNLAKKEQEAADMRIAIMLSQIAPHFIYNTLATIKGLCRLDPLMAEQTVLDFSNYLRGNLNSLSEKEPIMFERELKHLRSYCAIEQKRFGDRVQVEYDLEAEDFLIPALSIQPLVENAIKHGLCRKSEGGKVKIITRRTPGLVTVIIEDNGAGFDVSEKMDDGKVHVGINNVRKRIEGMCQGTLKVESEVGKGTRVTLQLPQTIK